MIEQSGGERREADDVATRSPIPFLHSAHVMRVDSYRVEWSMSED